MAMRIDIAPALTSLYGQRQSRRAPSTKQRFRTPWRSPCSPSVATCVARRCHAKLGSDRPCLGSHKTATGFFQ